MSQTAPGAVSYADRVIRTDSDAASPGRASRVPDVSSPPVGRPRWLDDDQQEAWRALLKGYAHIMGYLAADMQSSSGMPLTWYDVLVHLSEAPERTLCMTDLASSVFISRSGLTRLVDRMEKHGFVRRAVAVDDRRRMMATLTDDGYRALVDAAPGHVSALRRVFMDGVSPDDARQLTHVMGKVDFDAQP